MQRLHTPHYHNFTCTASACPDTCCQCWQIIIDEASLERYEAMGLQAHLDKSSDEVCFVQDPANHSRCTLLREDLLCSLVLEHGEEMLCDTCHMYPRHIEEFDGVREYSLSLSCPEVARLVLADDELPDFVATEDDEPDCEDYDEAEQLMYEPLAALRSRILRILCQHELPLQARCGFILDMVADFQEQVDFADEENPFDLDEFLAEYDERIEAGEYPEFSVSLEQKRALFEILEQWEYLDADWGQQVQQAKALVFGDKAAAEHDVAASDYPEDNLAAAAFDELAFDELVFAPYFEQLIWYFIYTYFCGSVYSEYYYGQAHVAVVGASHIYWLVLARWLQQGRKLAFEDICQVAYKYSRELEHSQYNLLLMERLLG